MRASSACLWVEPKQVKGEQQQDPDQLKNHFLLLIRLTRQAVLACVKLLVYSVSKFYGHRLDRWGWAPLALQWRLSLCIKTHRGIDLAVNA